MSTLLYHLSPTETHIHTYLTHTNTHIPNHIHPRHTHTLHPFPDHVTTSHAHTTNHDPPPTPPHPRAPPRRPAPFRDVLVWGTHHGSRLVSHDHDPRAGVHPRLDRPRPTDRSTGHDPSTRGLDRADTRTPRRATMKTTTTKKTSTVKKTATPAKKTVSRAKPAAKRPAKKAPVKKAASGGAPRADLDAVRSRETRRDARGRFARGVHHRRSDRLTKRKTRAIRRRSRSRSVTARRGSTVRFRATADSTRSSSERSRNTCNSPRTLSTGPPRRTRAGTSSAR